MLPRVLKLYIILHYITIVFHNLHCIHCEHMCTCVPCYCTSYSADTPTPFLLTPTSLLPNNTLITDVQQITGRDGQQWIKCTRGEARGRADIKSVNGTTISKNLGIGSYPDNGLYHCSARAQTHYVSFFLKKLPNSSKCTTYL